MAKLSLNPETKATVNEHLDRARGGVAALRSVLFIVPLPKRETSRLQSLLTKVETAVELIDATATEADNAPVTKTEVRAAIKDATPEQVAAIAAILNKTPAPAEDAAPEEIPTGGAMVEEAYLPVDEETTRGDEE